MASISGGTATYMISPPGFSNPAQITFLQFRAILGKYFDDADNAIAQMTIDSSYLVTPDACVWATSGGGFVPNWLTPGAQPNALNMGALNAIDDPGS